MADLTPSPGDLVVCWFSCGAASAVAASLTLAKYGSLCQVAVVNNPIAEEHPDNRRFLQDVSAWLGVPIQEALHPDYLTASAEAVWDKERFMSGPLGAPCTRILKKGARQHWEAQHHPDWHVLGFTAEERTRYDRFTETERPNVLPILIEAGLTKQDCFHYLLEAGIQPPAVYALGYPNANCLGCVKATSPTYWNHVRRTHPEVFAARAEQSRRLGARLARYNRRRVFLDELPPDAVGKPMRTLSWDCGIFCEERY